ncbi:cytochrome P450 [Clavulina sp. PMI_390]|nr:cytochrome P450 [Clavulina sp. PMI_390]
MPPRLDDLALAPLSSSYNIFVTTVLLLSIAAAVVQRFGFRSSRKPLPPGPAGDFILGNARQIPDEFAWLHYEKLSKSFGDVVHLNALGQPVVVLSSTQAISDVMGERGAVVSARPSSTFLGKLVGWDQSVVLSEPSTHWQAQRRLLHQYLGATSMPAYHSIIEEEARAFCHRVLATTEGFMDESIQSMAKLIMRTTYGINSKRGDEQVIAMANEVAENFEYSMKPGRFVVDAFPSLRYLPSWFPGADFRQLSAEWKQQLHNAINTPFDRVKADMAAGKAEPSFAARVLADRPLGINDGHIKWAAGSIYATAVRNTMATLGTFLLAMIMHPDVQEKAQAELDREIGQDRLPSISDRPNLPYIESVFKEVLRWHPAAPLAMPHRSTEDIEYRGWTIPKNSIVYGNTWALGHDPEIYPSPEKFNPDRYTAGTDVKDPREYAFGFGRRACSGQAFAESTVWTIMATLLATNHMKRALDENGNEIAVAENYTHSTPHHPIPFSYRFESRSAHIMSLLNASVETSA